MTRARVELSDAEAAALWRSNKDKVAERAREYYAANKDKVKAQRSAKKVGTAA